MDEKEIKYINDIVGFKIRRIAGNGGYSYLDSNSYMWRDGGGYEHRLSEMDKRYLRNCLKEVKNASKFINILYESVKEVTNIDDSNYSEEDKEQVMDIVKEHLRELMNEKKKELEEELETR